MHIYLDTGNVEEIKAGVATGTIDGVTTNPTLIAKEGRDFETVIKEIATIFSKAGKKNYTVSAEVTAQDATTMVKQALPLTRLAKNILIKIPLIPEGLKAIHLLSQRNIRTNATLCFSLNQAILAAKAGAYVVSPFVGRLDDTGHDGMQLIQQIRTVYDRYSFSTKILTASVRHPLHVTQAALAGTDIITLPYAVFQKLIRHPLTDAGNKRFLADWSAYLSAKKQS
ncbi:fructose-6-phosphate aldolase [Candidatus Woesearchaeota archaeon]|nr:MAG: fructose-6-phosphate aldolase [Candidatus Woesearchaeota archaeon]